MKQLRAIGYVLQPLLVIDDGENLTPVEVPPINITTTDWPSVVDNTAKVIEELQQQLSSVVQETTKKPTRKKNYYGS